MRKGSSVSDQDKHLTEAEKQIRRLEALRQDKEQVSRDSVEKTYFPPKSQAAKMEERLRSMRRQAERPAGSKRRPKIEGKQKSSKLTFTQIKILEQLLAGDKRLRGSVVTRIALNRLLGLENTPEENDLEARVSELLRQYKSNR